jgi:AraC-like ligand binding domain
MLAGAEACEVGPGTLVFVPPATPHAIRSIGGQQLVYVSATLPPFEAAITARHGRSHSSDRERRPAFTRLAEMRPTMTGEGADGDCW